MNRFHEIPPDVFETMFGKYWIQGFPVVSLSNLSTNIIKSEVYNSMELNLPNEIEFIIMEYTDICFFHTLSNVGDSLMLFMNMPISKKKQRPFGFVLFQNNWYMIYIEQCSARFMVGGWKVRREQYMIHRTLIVDYVECNNIVVSPGNGKHSSYGSTAFGCCIQHVAANKRYNVIGDKYSCRACIHCVNKVRNSIEGEFYMVGCGVDLDGWRLISDKSNRHYEKRIGDIYLADVLRKKQLNIKYEHIRTDTTGTATPLMYTRPSSEHIEQCPDWIIQKKNV